jgi:hypothetical protein
MILAQVAQSLLVASSCCDGQMVLGQYFYLVFSQARCGRLLCCLCADVFSIQGVYPGFTTKLPATPGFDGEASTTHASRNSCLLTSSDMSAAGAQPAVRPAGDILG